MNHTILAIVVAVAVTVALVGTINLLPIQAYAKHSKGNTRGGTLASDSTVNQGQGPQGMASGNPNDVMGGQQGPMQSTAAPGNTNNNAPQGLAALQLMQQMQQGANPNGGTGGQQAPTQPLTGPVTGSAGPSNTAAAPQESLAQVMGLVKDFLQGQR